jgi:redox-sensitive bicupin YhaK (pirin superfamily)
MNTANTDRRVEEVLLARAASDGDGVQLKRVFGGNNLARFDPFLMLDEFGSDKAADYIGGFPSHPHRGFETVTYMLEGLMEHRDHMGNVGLLQPGDVQWMKAGSGVIHSEMPKQEEGQMRGFQLWVNLPAAEKMTPATYNDIAADSIPGYTIAGAQIKAIAGELAINGTPVKGVVTGLSTDPGYLDIAFTDGSELEVSVPENYTALVYIYEGNLTIGSWAFPLSQGHLARLSRGDKLILKGSAGTRVLVITGKPIGEPIVHYGPFVMNSPEQIRQAINDYNSGTLVASTPA